MRGLTDAEAKREALRRVEERARAEATQARARATLSANAREVAERRFSEALRERDEEERALRAMHARAVAKAETAIRRLEAPETRERWRERRAERIAKEVSDAVECAVAFALGGDALEVACGGVFVDASRRGEAGRLARVALGYVNRALEASERVGDLSDRETRAYGDASIALEAYCQDVENDLLEQFSKALGRRAYAEAKTAAEALFNLNGGVSVVSRFIATREMFLSSVAMEEMQSVRDTVERSLSAERTGSACVERVERYFNDICAMVRKEYQQSIITAFGFSNGRAVKVLNVLLRRIMEQRIGCVVEVFLGAAIRSPNALHLRLALTATTLRGMNELNRIVRELTNDHLDLEFIDSEAFFGIGSEALLDDECASLDAVPSDDELFSTLCLNVSDERAMDAFGERFKDVFRRLEMYMSEDYIGGAQLRISEVFVARVTRLAQRVLRETIASTRGASARFTSSTSRDESRSEVFEPLLRATSNVSKWFRRTSDSIASVTSRLSKGTVNQTLAVAQNQLANDLSEALQVTATRAVALLDAKFRGIQRLDDFASVEGRETTACAAIIDVLRGLSATAKDCLDSTNAESLVNEIVEQFYSLLFMHVCRFKYSMLGGMQLKLDLNAYVEWARQAGVKRALVVKLEAFSLRTNVLVVSADAVDVLVQELDSDAGSDDSKVEIGMLRDLRAD